MSSKISKSNSLDTLIQAYADSLESFVGDSRAGQVPESAIIAVIKSVPDDKSLVMIYEQLKVSGGLTLPIVKAMSEKTEDFSLRDLFVRESNQILGVH